MRPLFGEEEKREIDNYLMEDGFFTEYKKTEEFENSIKSFTGAKHCIVVNNGTISLTLAAIALGVKSGDEVIVPNYTMIATPNSVKLIGAEVKFVDVEPDTLVMDIEKVRKVITKKTKLIILVSANGRAPKCGIEKFKDLSLEYGIPILEDAAQSLGSFYDLNTHIGRIGKIGSFSFSAPKIISTGQGGALITDDDELAESLRKLKDFGRTTGGTDVHDSIGYNFKFTELQACVGLAQMRKLPERIIRKKEIWDLYNTKLEGISQVKLFHNDTKYCSPWFIDAVVENRTGLEKYLSEIGIGTRKMYPPINAQKAYQLSGSYPVSERIGVNGLWLPSMVQLENDEINWICREIRNFYEAK